MAPFFPLFGAVLVVLIGLVALQFMPGKRRKRRIAAAARVDIEKLRQGALAKVQGTVVLDDAVESPITRQRCACWRVEASYLDYSRHDQRMQWNYFIQQEVRHDFRLQDETGTVRVAAQAAKLDLLPSVKEHQNYELPEHIAGFLKSNGFPPEQYREGKPHPMRFQEWTIAEGARLQVFGQVQSGLDGPLLVSAPGAPVTVQEEKPDWL